uniref:DUF7036 domain-containing protein n=1 Tax=Leersia perrieri TaxID=77586 RepID=A0A0D9VA25_9ORYZ
MGKEAGEGQDQQRPPDGAGGGGGDGGGRGGRGRGGSAARRCCGGARGVVRLKCVAALVLGVAVLLSALFWLPPFARHGRGSEGPDPGAGFEADIVASFRLHKTVPELNGNASRLELDIYEEIGIPNSTVVVNSLQQLVGSNWTNVIFSIVPYPKNLTLSSTGLSILRSYFMNFVVRQSTLQLTESLFGNSTSFEVIKFPGGITIIPPQTAFLPQKPHATFNFTLNFPIYKVQDRIDELKDQMKTGLLLNSYENLYIKLANLNGSTIDPPTIVETSIFLEVGNHQPSVPRMKQLAQTITNSSSGNLVALPPHSLSPRNPGVHSRSPIPSPPVLPEPPLPTVSFAHAHPPSPYTSRRDPAGMPSLAPAPYSYHG